MNDGFDFQFDQDAVRNDVFDSGSGSQFPVIVWHGKYSGPGSDCGFWTLDAAEAENAPGEFWKAAEVQFGGDPNAPLSSVWRTERLRACVLGVRKRILITDAAGATYSYPWLTKKENRVPGAYKSHFQVAIALPDTGDRIFQISLRGFSKSVAWGNPPSGSFRNAKFPAGVESILTDYAARASQHVKATIPPLCSFWIDLVPLRNEKGEKTYSELGHGTYASIFTADLSIGNGSGIERRFVGMEAFRRFQELREGQLLEWEKAWAKRPEANFGAAPGNLGKAAPLMEGFGRSDRNPEGEEDSLPW